MVPWSLERGEGRIERGAEFEVKSVLEEHREDIEAIAGDIAWKTLPKSSTYGERRADVIQRVLERVETTYNPTKARLSTFVTMVARGAAVDVMKAELRRAGIPTKNNASSNSPPLAGKDVEDTGFEELGFDRADLHSDVARVMATLTDRERTICQLVMEGYTDPEIGEQLGISKQRVHQLRVGLRSKFECLRGDYA